jgi:hypothetical protein
VLEQIREKRACNRERDTIQNREKDLAQGEQLHRSVEKFLQQEEVLDERKRSCNR